MAKKTEKAEDKYKIVLDKTKPQKCSKDGWCRTMSAMVENDYGKGKPAGIVEFVLFNIKTLKRRSAGFIYKRNRYDLGLILNFCPWCGERIDEYISEIHEEGKAEAQKEVSDGRSKPKEA